MSFPLQLLFGIRCWYIQTFREAPFFRYLILVAIGNMLHRDYVGVGHAVVNASLARIRAHTHGKYIHTLTLHLPEHTHDLLVRQAHLEQFAHCFQVFRDSRRVQRPGRRVPPGEIVAELTAFAFLPT